MTKFFKKGLFYFIFYFILFFPLEVGKNCMLYENRLTTLFIFSSSYRVKTEKDSFTFRIV